MRRPQSVNSDVTRDDFHPSATAGWGESPAGPLRDTNLKKLIECILLLPSGVPCGIFGLQDRIGDGVSPITVPGDRF